MIKSVPPLEGVPLKLLIDGARTDAAGGASFATLDPATGEPLGEVPEADAGDVDRAVQAARRALQAPEWRDAIPSVRERWLSRLADDLERDRDAFALLETLDNGMPIKLAERLVDRAVANLRYYAGWPTKIVGETMVPSIAAGRERYFAFTLKEAVGVVAAIIPWNASITSATAKLGPALACGNTVVLKPSENTPLTVLRLAALIERTPLPPGVVNIVTGGPEAGRALVEHPGVDLVAFTGSTAVGQSIVRASAPDLKRVLLELGGKSPNIIFADADLRRATSGAARAVFGNSGQVCTAGSRIFVERAALDEVREGIAAFARRLRIGPGVDRDTQMGPVVSAAQRERILSYVASASDDGAELVTGGGAVERDDLGAGYYVEPTVFTGVHRDMRIVREEVFGPVATITPFDDVAEVIDAANDTQFGLAAGVWTRDLDKAHAVTRGVRAGCVWVNTYGLNDHSVPFGGYGLSGYGREYARTSIDEYTGVKSVWHALTPVEDRRQA